MLWRLGHWILEQLPHAVSASTEKDEISQLGEGDRDGRRLGRRGRGLGTHYSELERFVSCACGARLCVRKENPFYPLPVVERARGNLYVSRIVAFVGTGVRIDCKLRVK